jgi:hypothetical protein
VYVEVSESGECVESRLAARGDGIEGNRPLHAVETVMKSSDTFSQLFYSPGNTAQKFYSDIQSFCAVQFCYGR